MIYITGDCHREYRRFNTQNFPEQKGMTKEDYVIVCGDFGGVWSFEKEDKEEKHLLDWLEEKPFTTLFVDGNHENFDRLYGGKVHKIRPSVLHLMRGQVFEICNRSIFTFGGASSHDISGGILEMDTSNFHREIKRLNRVGIPYRINHWSWWAQELPSKEEMEEGRKSIIIR